MKQHITIEQLKELSHPAMDRLSDWMHENGYKDEGWAKFLTIGRMIEFIDDNLTTDTATLILLFERCDNDWENLCDALWEEVKKLL